MSTTVLHRCNLFATLEISVPVYHPRAYLRLGRKEVLPTASTYMVVRNSNVWYTILGSIWHAAWLVLASVNPCFSAILVNTCRYLL